MPNKVIASYQCSLSHTKPRPRDILVQIKVADFEEIETDTLMVFLLCSIPKKGHLFLRSPQKYIDNSQSPDFYCNLQSFGLPTPDFQCFKVERSARVKIAWYYFAGSSHSIYINWKQNFLREKLRRSERSRPWSTAVGRSVGRSKKNAPTYLVRPWSTARDRSIDRRSAAGVAYYDTFTLRAMDHVMWVANVCFSQKFLVYAVLKYRYLHSWH